MVIINKIVIIAWSVLDFPKRKNIAVIDGISSKDSNYDSQRFYLNSFCC